PFSGARREERWRQARGDLQRRRIGARARDALVGRVKAAAAFAIAMTFASAARADPTAADRETARALLDEGDKKIEEKDLEGALKAYRAADAIMGVPTTGIEVSKTLAAMGQLLSARDKALEVSRYPKKQGEPSAFTQARTESEQLAESLGERIPSLR